VAEIRPIEPAKGGLDARWAELEARGEIQGGKPGPYRFPVGERVPGALKRFLADR
jgi:hypothetical protein